MKQILNILFNKNSSNTSFFSNEKLYHFTLKTLLALFFFSIIFLYLFWERISDKFQLIVWFMAIQLLIVWRIYDYIQFMKRYTQIETKMDYHEKKLNSLLDQAPVGIFYYDKDLNLIHYNNMFKNILALNRELSGFNLKEINDPKAIEVMKEVLYKDEQKETIGSYNFSYQDKNIWAELTCSAMHDEQGEVLGGIGILEDKTIEHRAYEKINYISLHDTLTKLPNRRFYINFMHDLINAPQNKTHYSLLLYMDLNRFKQINDTFGHTVGDKLLLEVANRFQSLEIENAHLARLGGDEFVLVIPFVSTEAGKAKDKASYTAKRIKSLFQRVFEIEGLNLYMTTSIGIVIIQPQTDNIDSIIRQADMAMYQTKREGEDNISFYNKKLDLQQQELTSLQQDLSHAISNNELTLYYQPIVNIQDDSLTAIEALVRWNHPTKGLIMPDKFIPMATESGLINKLGWWVLKEVCRQLSKWQSEDKIFFEYVSININARQLHEINFSKLIEKSILDYGIDPSMIKLEVTETTLIDSFSKTQQVIKDLRQRGVECSIDDFGTGYSSLAYLRQLPLDILKIDKSFIDDLPHSLDDTIIIDTIISLASKLGLKTIAEGVETKEQVHYLIDAGCTSAQGYFFDKPLSAKNAKEALLNKKYTIKL